jgi:sec-independent protein translocase protein TatB
MSFSETIFLFVLALVIFGPKKLPEIARQAGRLLAELRRASNEFKSQIETEIAHLEVEKKQTILPPADPPQGVVASLSLNPAASEAVPHQSGATLAAPAEAPVASSTSISNPAIATPEKPSLGSDSAALVSSTSEPAASPAARDSHV